MRVFCAENPKKNYGKNFKWRSNPKKVVNKWNGWKRVVILEERIRVGS